MAPPQNHTKRSAFLFHLPRLADLAPHSLMAFSHHFLAMLPFTCVLLSFACPPILFRIPLPSFRSSPKGVLTPSSRDGEGKARGRRVVVGVFEAGKRDNSPLLPRLRANFPPPRRSYCSRLIPAGAGCSYIPTWAADNKLTAFAEAREKGAPKSKEGGRENNRISSV